MGFSKNDVTRFRNEFKNAVADLELKFNVDISLGAIRYNEKEFSSKMTVIKLDDTSTNESKDQSKWNALCEKFGLTPEHFGTTMEIRGEIYTIVGLKPSAKNRPSPKSKFVIIECNRTGKRFVTSVIDVLAMVKVV